MDDLQALIDLALSDGNISDGEMNLIRGKAITLGVDESTLYKLIDVRKGLVKPTSNTLISRCPNCKEPVKELATVCDWCGHSLSKVMDRETVTAFHQRIVASEGSNRVSLIASYPLPVSRQEIIEILSIAVPASRQFNAQERQGYVIKVVGLGEAVYHERMYQLEAEARAWGTKAQAIIDNARFLYQKDEAFLTQLKSFEVTLGQNLNRFQIEQDKIKNEINATFNRYIMPFLILTLLLAICGALGLFD